MNHHIKSVVEPGVARITDAAKRKGSVSNAVDVADASQFSA